MEAVPRLFFSPSHHFHFQQMKILLTKEILPIQLTEVVQYRFRSIHFQKMEHCNLHLAVNSHTRLIRIIQVQTHLPLRQIQFRKTIPLPLRLFR